MICSYQVVTHRKYTYMYKMYIEVFFLCLLYFFFLNYALWQIRFVVSNSTRVVHSPSHSDVTLIGRPTLGPYDAFPDVVLGTGVCRKLSLRQTRRRSRCNVFSTPTTNKDVRKKRSYWPKAGRPLNDRQRLAAFFYCP